LLVQAALITAVSGVSAQGLTDPKAILAQDEGVRVSIDPLTKQVRPVTDAESKALERSAPAATAATKPVTLHSRFAAARGVRLGAQHMSYASASIDANGKVNMACVEGEEAATHARHGGAGIPVTKAVEAERE
jgi:hypothetical protein